MPDRSPPDFAMLRAVEVLAQMHERARKKRNTPPPPLDRPVVLHSTRIAFELGKTTRGQVERELGIAFSYPVRGWHTYGTREGGKMCLLSLFYRSQDTERATLLAAELYVPRSDRAPALSPRDLGGFRLEPGGVAIGIHVDSISGTFTAAVGGPGAVVYDRSFEARFPGGVAYAMARKGTIERLALYAGMPPA
jgi:hypothetical protein